MRAFLPGGKQKPVDTRAAENVPPARPAIQDAAGFAQPRYQQDAYAPYPGQPQMPPQAMYPAPPPQAYSPVQQPGYQQPAQMPPAGYPSQPIPAAGGERYSQAQRPLTHPEPGAPEGGQQGQIDEIRASLREFRDAVRELTESRSKRRYF